MTLTSYITFLKAHERLLIVAAVLFFGVHLVDGGFKALVNHDNAKVQVIATQVSKDQSSVRTDANTALQANVALQSALTQAQTQNALLAKALQQASASLASVRTTDSTLGLPALGDRMVTLVPSASGGVTSTSDGLTLRPPAALAVVQQLEAVPVLQEQLKDETQVAANDANALGKCQDLVTDQKVQIGDLKKETIDLVTKDKTDVAAEKVKTKRAFWRGFKYGFITGFGVGAYIVHGL